MGFRARRKVAIADDGSAIAWHTHLAPGGEPAPKLPAVVLSNGIGTTENFWRYLVGGLQPDHRVVHWDYRGHGSSGLSASGDYSLRTQAADLARITREVMAAGDGRPPVQLGFSMGVAVVLELYRTHPELMRALVLIAGAPDAPGTGTLLFRVPGAMAVTRRALKAFTPWVPKAAPAVRKVLGSKLVYTAGRALGVLRARAPREDVDQMMAGISRMDPTAYWLTLRGLMDADATDVLPMVRAPTLIVAAADDVLMPGSQVRRMREGLPDARFVQVEDAGHAGLLEAGTEIAEAVGAFVRGLGY